MNFEKVVFGFFVLLAATLNFGFFLGDIDDPVVRIEAGIRALEIVSGCFLMGGGIWMAGYT